MIVHIGLNDSGYRIEGENVVSAYGAGVALNFVKNFFFFVYHGRDLDDRLYYVLFPRGYRWEKHTPKL